MARKDDGFNLEDMMEIFGDGAAPAPSRAAAAGPEELTQDEQALLKAYEQGRQERLRREEVSRRREAEAAREEEERRLVEDYERRRAARGAAGPAASPPSSAPVPPPPPAPDPALPARSPVLAPPGPARPQPLPPNPLLKNPPVPVPAEPGVAPPYPEVPRDVGGQESDAFCALLEETRMATLAYLVPLIGIKATNNMLIKSVEKARSLHPVVLKDVNWRVDGSLREDGSVDPDRLVKNAAALGAGTRVADTLAGLKGLVDLRMRAVEAGLGGTAGAELKSRLGGLRSGPAARALPAAWVDLFFRQVLP